jgi:hypothetical protein
MLYDLLEKSDIIEIDGMMLSTASLHPQNGLEGTALSKTDNGASYDYKISIENLNFAKLIDDHWHVKYTIGSECFNATIQCFSKKLITLNEFKIG